MDFQKLPSRWILAACAAFTSLPAAPQATPPAATVASPDMIRYCNNPYIAYIRTSPAHVDDMTAKGMRELAGQLRDKTSYEPKVAALDIEADHDKLLCFSFIYWPVTADTRTLSPAARKSVQNHIDTGGAILFDIIDQSAALSQKDMPQMLAKKLGGLVFRPLAPLHEDHTLARALFITGGLPGSKSFGPVWVEASGPAGENVSSVIIGDNNWAAAWAGITLATDSKERETALRAGINMVLYGPTGTLRAKKPAKPDSPAVKPAP